MHVQYKTCSEFCHLYSGESHFFCTWLYKGLRSGISFISFYVINEKGAKVKVTLHT